MMFREGQAHSPTKSERNSGVLEGLVRREVRWFGNPSGSRPNFSGDCTSPLTRDGIDVVLSEGWYSNPSVLTAEKFSE